MSDIFGRDRHQYGHIRALDSVGEEVWSRHQEALVAQRGGNMPHHDFDALGAWGSAIPEAFERAEPNAQALGYLTNNLLAIQGMADEILYTEHRLPELVPINTMIPEGAETYAVRVIDRVGEGDYITNDGSDAPNATASQRLVPHGLDYAGIDAEWTVEDIRNAMFAGFPLENESLQAAVRGAQNHMERVGLVGHNGKGYKGLTNWAAAANPNRNQVKLISGADVVEWSDAGTTAEEIRDAINGYIGQVIADTDEIFSRTIRDGLAVYLPVVQYNTLVSRRVGDNVDKTILRSLEEDNPWTARTGNRVQFKSLIELAGAGGGGTDRMIVAVMDSRIFEMGVSIMPRVLRIMDKGRVICAQVEYKFGSIFMKRPTTVYYVDGI